MDCNRWREMASDYIEGTLPPATRAAMERHTAECADCRRDEAGLAALARELNVLPTVDPPLFFRENVMAAIERQANVAPTPGSAAWWRQLVLGNGTMARPDRVARLAVGTALAGGLAAAIVWGVFFPNTGSKENHAGLPIAEPLQGILPGGESASASTRKPLLRVTRVTTMAPNVGPAYDLSFWLSNANSGVARWQFVGDPRAYNFALNGNAPQTVRIPFTAAQGKNTVAVYLHWTADSVSHSRYLLLPVNTDETTPNTTLNSAPVAPAARQSFGLPEESIVDAARDIAGHYRVPVTLDDVTNGDHPVRITAESETAQETLQRSLRDAGLDVTQTAAGIRIAPATVAASPAPAAVPTP